ncbi:iron(III) transport system ATP-binding protein [Paracoccus pantotrophus]|nr:iron(III) transport system ATP-binding protein [Paracoccus pantotrophus]
MAAIEMEAVVRAFGATRAVDGVSLAVPPGAFLALLGPSGCGKTTLLRLIAGLERPDAGRIALGGRLVAGPGRFVAPEARGLGMVFQSYALWPHMTVAGNIRFGLRIQRLSRAEERARIGEALEMVGLSGMADRRPHQLSGGQRQRVALARSLAVRPGLILLDEPLANLDAHLRETMLAEFRRIHAALRTTFVFVTHDQDEAMAVAGLVGVMNAGRLEQLASPADLYRRPATPMVARFVGRGRTVPVQVLGRSGGLCRIALQGRVVAVPGDAPPGPGWLCLRPRDLAATAGGGLRARVLDHRFQGGGHLVTAALEHVEDGGTVDFTLPRPPHPGETVELALTGGWILPREALRAETPLQHRLLAGAGAGA